MRWSSARFYYVKPGADMDKLISVVVPTYKRPQLLKQCLVALCSQDLSADMYEIIVADDGPSEDTRLQVEAFASQFPSGPFIRYTPVTGRHGPAAARNTGWRMATTVYIAFTDDDCQPAKEWLREGLQALQQGADAAWGKLIMPITGKPTDYEKDASQLANAEFVTANCFCKKAVLERTGGFDEQFRLAWREDSDLFFNLMDAGSHIVHAPRAVVVHPVRPAPWGVSISQQRKVLFDALLYKKHPNHYRTRIRAYPPWDYYVIVVSLFSALILSLSHHGQAALMAMTVWLVLTIAFMLRRLNGTAHTPSHIAEMAVTSIIIPAVALYWHWRGVLKFRIMYL